MEDGQSEDMGVHPMETNRGETGLHIEDLRTEEVDHQEVEDHQAAEDNPEEEVHQGTEDHPEEVEDLLAEDHPEDHPGRSPECLGVLRKEKKATRLTSKACLLSRALEPGNLHFETRLLASAEIRKEASYG